jgi:hypothetical protein
VAAETVRYHATSRYAYGYALLLLTEQAREHDGEPFVFGPLTLEALEVQGLQVSGEDLQAVTDSLSRAPGLVKIPE